ncbi:undecaprenyl/decaprenyl-phosphate alpha-N-acetylglucosaminyl 1-phosphate transferase [Glaciibacter flavus]|uniref:Undecaprenyl/decaprenyl-phosphate alpha-N-acetylglucosaminyl 1-phosphate transferase n=1 Tax=Orlajensenia flava TaxID=2565934 RepID=A0A4S4FYT6_9MICO|nr:MraY family glycosyltransferase [Glaciibacter flavus]THG35618.1 undecaprenyl/decaprenyl-phosphate alpha-N-acetylglucosaminyl 1-phosphate transferase [Glaciibacter flavus]
MTLFISLALITALITFGLSLVIYRLAHRFRLYPKIRERDVHTRPTPRLGGVAMFLGVVGAVLVAWAFSAQLPPLRIVFANPEQILAILGAAALIVAIGVADDIWDLDWMTKLAGQFIAAGLIAWKGVQIYALPLGQQIVGTSLMSLIITIFAIVLVMNAINFIDGLDGLVAGVALIANGVFFLYTYLLVQQTSPSNYFNLASVLAAIVVGACAGFLPLNWHPARLFMGDAGALLIGLLMATSAIAVTGQTNTAAITALGRSQLLPAFIPIILPFAVLVIPLLDFGLAVVRRLRAGKSPFSADRKHLHHRLLDMGHSHLHAVLILYGWTAVASVGCLLYFVLPTYAGLPSWWATVFLAVGFIVCTVLTLAPLSRRKAVEAVSQATDAESPEADRIAVLDPLDEASETRLALDDDGDELEPESLPIRRTP